MGSGERRYESVLLFSQRILPESDHGYYHLFQLVSVSMGKPFPPGSLVSFQRLIDLRPVFLLPAATSRTVSLLETLPKVLSSKMRWIRVGLRLVGLSMVSEKGAKESRKQEQRSLFLYSRALADPFSPLFATCFDHQSVPSSPLTSIETRLLPATLRCLS